jgi:hypothetical protein
VDFDVVQPRDAGGLLDARRSSGARQAARLGASRGRRRGSAAAVE